VAWLAGVTGVLVLFGAVVVGFFVWLTVIEVQDEKARAGYAAWREKHRDRSYREPAAAIDAVPVDACPGP
jgi:hypothetical protein